MELTLRYYYYFDVQAPELVDGLNNRLESWDVLRTKGAGINRPFYISDNRDIWQKGCLSNGLLRSRAIKIAEFLKGRFHNIYSFGVGSAQLEFLIKKENPLFQIRCSDFAPKGVERLKKVFWEADAITVFDIINGNWGTIESTGICLFYRVDAEFEDEEWEAIFRKMTSAGVRHVLFIPSEMISLKRILYLSTKYLIFKLLRKKMTFCGFVRTKERFISLFTKYFNIVTMAQFHDMQGFLLSSHQTP